MRCPKCCMPKSEPVEPTTYTYDEIKKKEGVYRIHGPHYPNTRLLVIDGG